MNLAIDLQAAWKPYPKQARFVNSTALFSLMISGVGAGKSHAISMWCIARALRNDGATGALLGRTSIDLQSVLLPNLFDRFDELQRASGVNFIRSYDKGNAVLTLINDSRIFFRPFNRVEKLRGLTLTFACADEVEWSEAEPEEIWAVLTGRLRGKGPCPGLAFATSPNGYRGVTKRFVDAQRAYADAVAKGDVEGMRTWGQYFVVHARSMDNPFLPAHFHDSLKSMSKRRYAQEVEGRVLTPTNTVYQLEDRHVIPWRWQEHRELPRAYGVDWGTDSGFAAVMCQVMPSGVWVVADELIADETTRAAWQDRLHRWVDGHGVDPPPVMFGVDRAVPTENQILARRYRASRVMWMESKEDQAVAGGVAMIQDLMDPVDGEPMLLFSSSLAQTYDGRSAPTLPAMRGYSFHLDSEGHPTAKPRANTEHTHICDALRYAVKGSAKMSELHGGRNLVTREGTQAPVDRGPGNSGRKVK